MYKDDWIYELKSEKMSSVLNRPELSSRGSRPEDGVPDMIVISDIDENGINANLRTRYNRDQIYTFTGSILVAVNPYKNVPIYEQENVYEYSGQKLSSVEPHIFAISEAAFQRLNDNNNGADGKTNQSCIISGESGAGKTENTKFILQYLCSVTNHTSFWVEQQILEANTVLEAFGNAKTVRNDNSSRFGKFVQVCFDESCQIKGCIVQDYLLEQSRITFQSANERNYHVFYQFIAGAEASPDIKARFSVGTKQSYAYLNQSGCYTLDGVNDTTMFDRLRLALNVLSVTEEMVDGIFAILSSILWLGNLQFADVEGENSELTESDLNIVGLVCELLGLNLDSFIDALLFRQIQVRGTVTSIPFKHQEACENRHAMAKCLYSRTFAWLVDAVNKCTNPGQHQLRFIGILDIFGFENFEVNSFEQLCINYTNEKLHRFFNHYVFALEQETYRQEEIAFDHITFTDNSKCVELIEKPPRCVLKMLDEECRFPQGSDKSYLVKQHQELEDHPYYIKGNDRRTWEKVFGILHYAGAVTYTAAGFLDKNKDVQQDQLFELMHESTNPFVKDLTRFQDLLGVRLEDLGGRQTISRTTRGKPTVGDTFKHQLSALVDILSTTNPWYVRCIKPNCMKKANSYVDKDVVVQLSYSGMLDIIRIKREGYPVHVVLENFMDKYRCLLPDRMGGGEPRSEVKVILNALNLPSTDWQVGKTKVFMKNSVFEPLEERRYEFLRVKCVLIQKIWRGYIRRKEYLDLREATVIIQTSYRAFRDHILFKRKRKAVILLQSHVRGMIARRIAAELREIKRIEEERIRQEKMESERMAREKAIEDEITIEDTLKESQNELNSLTTLIESMWTHYEPTVSPNNLNLDQIFSFLQEERGLDAKGHQSNKTLDEITDELNELNDLLTEDMDITLWAEKQDAEDKKKRELREASIENLPPPPELTASTENLADTGPLPPPPSTEEELAASGVPSPPPPLPPKLTIPPPPSLPPDDNGFVPSPPPLPPVAGSPSVNPNDTKRPLPPPPPIRTNSRLSSGSLKREECSSLTSLEYQEIQNAISEIENIDTGYPVPPVLPPPPTIPAPPLPPDVAMDEHAKKKLALKKSLSIEVPDNINHNKLQVQGQTNVEALSPKMEQKLNNLLNEQEVKKGPDNIIPNGRMSMSPSTPMSPMSDGGVEFGEVYEMIEYAEKYFNDHLKDSTGTLMKSLKKRRNSVDKDIITKEEMLRYSKSGLIPTSHVKIHDTENVFLSCSIFKDITKCIKDDVKDDSAASVIQTVIKHGIERIELRDEILCQLIRQTNENPDENSLILGWLFLCLCTASFSPSKNLHKYLVSYAKRNRSHAVIGKYAQQCVKHVTVPRAIARKYPPSFAEIMSMRQLSPLICKVHFMDSKTKAVSIMPCDTTHDVLGKVAKKIGLQSVEGWSLYEVTLEYERYIRAYEYVADVLAHWERQEKMSAQPSKYETVSRKGPTMALGGNDARLVFRKRVYKHVHDIPNDPVEYHLLYAEAVNKVVKDEFSVSDKVALQLAGLQAQVILGTYKEGKDERYREVEQYLCRRILNIPNRLWSQEVAVAHKLYGAGKSELEAKVWYLTCVKQFPLYGCTLFPIVHKGLWSHSHDALLAINMDGVKFVRAKDKFVLHDFKYAEIESIALDPNDNYVTMELKNDVAKDCPQRCFMFETNHKEDLGNLISSYSPAHATWLKPDYEGVKKAPKKMKMTDEEKLKLYEDLVRARRSLSETRLLHRPIQDRDSSFFKNTLRRITKSRMERLRSCYTGGNIGMFDVSYWSYSKVALKQSLTAMQDPNVEELAIKVFNSILIYSGVIESGEYGSVDHVEMIQTVMLKCQENEALCNEYYLQLIKQTTDHPDPNSQVNKRNWQLMCVATSCVVPSNSRVSKYLTCHLRKCSLDTTTEEGKYARFCNKCLTRTQEKKNRKFPPSSKEIECIIARKPINEMVYLLNGDHRVIEFDAAATCGEVIRTVKAKIGMRTDAECFALYEVTGASERSMNLDERMSDTLSKWERLSKGSSLKDMKLVFKKRLLIDPYLNPIDPVECDLVFHQLIEDVFEHRVPITPQDAVRLCALKIQSESEEIKPSDIDYSSVMRILPRDMRPHVRVEDIVILHKSMSDLMAGQAVLQFIEVLKSWPLFGASVFDISQCFTSSLPKLLLLAVNQKGVHLLEAKTFRIIQSYEYTDVLHTSPAIKSIMLIVGDVAKGTKYMFQTNQATQIAHLIKDYTGELQDRSLLIPPKMDASMVKNAACRSSVFIDSYDEELLSAMLASNKA